MRGYDAEVGPCYTGDATIDVLRVAGRGADPAGPDRDDRRLLAGGRHQLARRHHPRTPQPRVKQASRRRSRRSAHERPGADGDLGPGRRRHRRPRHVHRRRPPRHVPPPASRRPGELVGRGPCRRTRVLGGDPPRRPAQVSRDVGTFSSAQGIRLEEMDAEETEARRTMMELDPPEHTAYRRLVSKPFSRREVYAYEQAIRTLARAVVEEALGGGDVVRLRRPHRQAAPDAHARHAARRPEDDGPWLVEQGDALLGNTDPEFTTHPVGLVDTDEFRLMPFRSPAGIELFRYAQEQARRRREHPTDDVISDLLRAEDRRRGAQRARVQQLLHAARRRRQRHDPLHDGGRHEGADRAARPARRAARRHRRRRRRPRRLGGRGDPAVGFGDDALPAHGDRRHRARRPDDPRRRQGA